MTRLYVSTSPFSHSPKSLGSLVTPLKWEHEQIWAFDHTPKSLGTLVTPFKFLCSYFRILIIRFPESLGSLKWLELSSHSLQVPLLIFSNILKKENKNILKRRENNSHYNCVAHEPLKSYYRVTPFKSLCWCYRVYYRLW